MDGRRWLFSKDQLANTPSRKCGISDDQELSYRQQAANFIQEMGQRLNVNQLCINTAIVYLHRFYMYHSFEKFGLHAMSAAALFLSAKVEEQPRKLEHIIKVYHLLRTKERTLDVNSDVYLELAQDLVINENVLLQTLGFNVQVDHPHSHVVKTCQLVRASKELAQTSYYLATNSLHSTTLCLQYNPKVVAALCIHLACKWSNWELSPSIDGKDWWQYIDSTITADQLEELTREFLNVLEKMDPSLRQKMLSLRGSAAAATGSPSSSRGPSPTPSRPIISCSQPARDSDLSAAASEGQLKHAAYMLGNDVSLAAELCAREQDKNEVRGSGDMPGAGADSSRAAALREHKARAAGLATGDGGKWPGAKAGDVRHPLHGFEGSQPRSDAVGRPRPEGAADRQKPAPSASSGKHPAPKPHRNHDGFAVADVHANRRPLHGASMSSESDKLPGLAKASAGGTQQPGESLPSEGSAHGIPRPAQPDNRHPKGSSSHPPSAIPGPQRHSSSHQSHHGGQRPLPNAAAPPHSSSSRSHALGSEKHSGSAHAGSADGRQGAHHQQQQQQRPPTAAHHHNQIGDRHSSEPGRAAAEVSSHRTSSACAHPASGEGHFRHSSVAAHDGHHRQPTSDHQLDSSADSAAKGLLTMNALRPPAHGSLPEGAAKRARTCDSASLSSPAKKQRPELSQQPASAYLTTHNTGPLQPMLSSITTETVGGADRMTESHYSMPTFILPSGLGRDVPRFGENGAAALQISSNGLSAAAAFASLSSVRSAGPAGNAAATPLSPVTYANRSSHSLITSATSLQSPPSPRI